MSRLMFVIAFTNAMDEMKKFYRDAIGLKPAADSPFFVPFENDGGASFSLLAVRPEQRREIELCFGTTNIEADVVSMRGRGVEFLGEIRNQEFGRTIHFRDVDGNLLSLLQSSGASASESSGPSGSSGRGTATAVATRVVPRLSGAVVNTRDVAAARLFYRDRLGLHIVAESPLGIRFEAGGTTIALRPLDEAEREADLGPSLAIGLDVPDLIDWADEARSRGVHFTTAPGDEGSGEIAEATDPDGNLITFREPPEEPALEEQLAEPFDDEGTPHQAAIRTSVKKKAKAVSRVALKPEREEKVLAVKKRKPKPKAKSSKQALVVSSVRGAGPEGSRRKPKRIADPKRARSRPATGRLKKAERRSVETKKTAVASASKGKPVKHTAKPARRGKPQSKGRSVKGRSSKSR